MSRESDRSMRNEKIIYDFMILIFNLFNSCADFWKTLSKAPCLKPFLKKISRKINKKEYENKR